MPTITQRPQVCPHCQAVGGRRWLLFRLAEGKTLEKPLQFECPNGHLLAGDGTPVVNGPREAS